MNPPDDSLAERVADALKQMGEQQLRLNELIPAVTRKSRQRSLRRSLDMLLSEQSRLLRAWAAFRTNPTAAEGVERALAS